MNLNPLLSESVIRELACGDISAEVSGILDTPALHQLAAERHQAYIELCATLSEEQRAILERYEDCRCDYEATVQIEKFTYAFKLGARMMMEILTKEDA